MRKFITFLLFAVVAVLVTNVSYAGEKNASPPVVQKESKIVKDAIQMFSLTENKNVIAINLFSQTNKISNYFCNNVIERKTGFISNTSNLKNRFTFSHYRRWGEKNSVTSINYNEKIKLAFNTKLNYSSLGNSKAYRCIS